MGRDDYRGSPREQERKKKKKRDNALRRSRNITSEGETSRLVGKDSADELCAVLVWSVMGTKPQVAGIHTGVVNLAGAGVDSLEKLVDFLVRHFLAQVRQDYSDNIR